MLFSGQNSTELYCLRRIKWCWSDELPLSAGAFHSHSNGSFQIWSQREAVWRFDTKSWTVFGVDQHAREATSSYSRLTIFVIGSAQIIIILYGRVLSFLIPVITVAGDTHGNRPDTTVHIDEFKEFVKEALQVSQDAFMKSLKTEL